MIIRQATIQDNEGLITLTAMTPMQGIISLRIDRKPDFFKLLQARGESVTFIAKTADEIVASVSASLQPQYVSGKPESIWYLADFKVHPAFRGTTAGFRVIKALADFLKKRDANLVFLSIAAGNPKILPFLEGRLGFPKMHLVGKFHVLQILPSQKAKKCTVRLKENEQASDALANFYTRFNRRYSMSPVVDPEELKQATNLLAFEGGQLKAAISLVNMNDMKQNVVIDMPFYLKLLVAASKILSAVFPVLRLPGKGEPLRMLNIRHFAYMPGGEESLRCLIEKARNIAFAEKYIFLSIGLDEKDPARAVFEKFTNIPFRSNGYAGSLQGSEDKIRAISKGPVQEDFSLV